MPHSGNCRTAKEHMRPREWEWAMGNGEWEKGAREVAVEVPPAGSWTRTKTPPTPGTRMRMPGQRVVPARELHLNEMKS